MKFKCNKHPDREIVLLSGYGHCSECLREIEREVLVKWCQYVRPELTRKHILKILGEMFKTEDFGFSTFSVLYTMLPRAVKKPKKNDFGFILSQSAYLQQAFLFFIKEGLDVQA